MKPSPLFSIQAPFARNNSSLPRACPAALPHPAPVPHYFPQLFLCLMCPSHSGLSCPGSMFPFFICSCLPHPVFIPSTSFSLCFFSPSLTGQRLRAPTNGTWLSPLLPRTGTVPGIHKKCLSQRSLALANPARGRV